MQVFREEASTVPLKVMRVPGGILVKVKEQESRSCNQGVRRVM